MSAVLPPGVVIRAATAADLPAIEALLGGSGLSAQGVEGQLAGFTVAEANGAIAGSAGLELYAGDALLRSLCVAPAWRGKGLGAHLVEHMLTEGAVQAVDDVYLLTMDAERFFARFGFLTVSRRDLPFTVTRAVTRAGGCPDSATPMHLRLALP